MSKRRVALLIALGVVALLVGGVFAAGTYLFDEPSARRVSSVVGEVHGTRVLGVFAHPDDEQTVNGLFSRAKREDGAYTYMITATRGEAGEQGPVVGRQEDLGDIRKAEALKNSYHLGVDHHEVWDYPDGGVPGVDEQELVDRVAAVMERERPDVVVTFWPGSGATGHKDHMRMGEVTEKAIAMLEASGDGYTGPKTIVYTISPTRALAAFGGEVGAFVVDNQPQPNLAMPAETQLKLDGWKIHASQENSMPESYYLPTQVIYTFWNKEYYLTRDLATDPLDS